MRPDHEAKEGNQNGGEHHRAVPEQSFARKGRNDLRDNAERRQNEDIHFGMAEDPENMLPEHRISARTCLEEISSENPVEGEQH
ncbi:hypothetical protein D3C81_2190920 [compost metagenome]